MGKLIHWFASALCYLLLISYSQNVEARWQEKYDLGVRYLSDGSYEEAVLAFTAAIEITPKQATTYSYLAESYVAMGDFDVAFEVL